MADPTAAAERPLNILHVIRAPLGGLFRHVLDLCREQVRRGHRVGLLADSLTGGDNAKRTLAELAPLLHLGLRRVPMRRNPHPADILPLWEVTRWSSAAAIDVLHGHGSKGGVYARLAGLGSGRAGPIRVYTPHGGSLNYRPGTLTHRIYMQAERLLAARTDLLLFESAYVAERYQQLVGAPRHIFKIVRNAIAESEFVPIAPGPDAFDFLYVGELRAVKGIDTLLDALASAGRTLGFQPRALLVGTGPDREALQRQADRLGLGTDVEFAGSLPARTAFSRGRTLVVPSRAESLPYIVLEAAGARVPLIATDVGGIPEIFGPNRGRLLPPGRVDLLAARMIDAISMPAEARAAQAEELARYVRAHFSIDAMAEGIIAGYRDALKVKHADPSAHWSARMMPSYDRGAET